jgi:hypothetical protein
VDQGVLSGNQIIQRWAMNEVLTIAVAFLSGTATGAAGHYFAVKYTDKRHRKESQSEEKALFEKMITMMPDLLAEMKTDLLPPERYAWRDFFVVQKGACLDGSKNSFIYKDDGANAYLSKVCILNEHGYVTDISSGGTPKFRMREHFVEKLQQWNPNA